MNLVPTTADDWRQVLQSNSPRGRLWAWELGLRITALWQAMGCELARLHNRALDLFEEADPETTVELLPDHERNWGLPDPAAPPPETIQERQAALAARVGGVGGQSKPYFLAIAEALGIPVEILLADPWAFWWIARGDAADVKRFRVGPGATVGTRLVVRSARWCRLEALYRRWKPSDSHLCVEDAP